MWKNENDDYSQLDIIKDVFSDQSIRITDLETKEVIFNNDKEEQNEPAR